MPVEEKEELWMLPVMFIIRRKDPINAFEVFQHEAVDPLIRILGDNDNIAFMFDHCDMVKHVHTDFDCTKTPITKEDAQLILKLMLPLEVLQKMDTLKQKVEGFRRKMLTPTPVDQCPRCEGKGKIKEGAPPIVEIRKCPDCDGTGKRNNTHGGSHGEETKS